MSNLKNITSIIVHNGGSHNDEILAVAIALSAHGSVVPVYRRDPDDSELSDTHVLVLDVGGLHDPEYLDFDHHQLDRSAPATCVFTLLSDYLGVGTSLEAFFPWYSTWKTIDAKGPFAWAASSAAEWSKVEGLLSPVSGLVHDWWEESESVDPALLSRLLATGRKILAAADRFEDFWARGWQKTVGEIDGVKYCDFTWATAEEAKEFGGAFARKEGIQGGVLVSRDDRGPGLALFRRDDDPRVDFSVLEGNPLVTFAHKGGFIAKTSEEGAKAWEDLVALAIKKS